ncbi:MAG TPA: FadR/GntR family transcriptional regulator [Thermohalobaculum sp.]|nr:FadR/GntR family transcriptional regulator [Thermohalobaculum sp.]
MNAADIAGALRRQIASARFTVNDRLPPERTLAEQFGVARGTVREALRQLEESGFVRRRAGSGTYVTFSEEDETRSIVETTRPLELIDARVAIEPHMVRLAVLHSTDFDLAKAEAHLQAMESCGGDSAVFAETDERFHLALARCSHNPLIYWMMQKMHEVRSHSQWARMRTITLEPGIIAVYNRQHRGIVEAIRARNSETASRLMREHLETARRSLVGAAT